MAKRSHQPTFRSQPMADLARQLRYAPKARQVEQLHRAERLHDEIDPAINYPLEYIAYRITRIRPPTEETVLMVGEAVKPDLRLIIDALSFRHPPDQDETPTYTSEELARHLGVSTRTVARWRHRGLRWRWICVAGASKPRIGFTEQAVAAFAVHQPRRIEQASQFTHLSDAERDKLLRRARRIASVAETSPHQLARHLARRTGRGVETIRQLLQQHDHDHPDRRIFVNHTGPLTPKQQRIIVRAFSRGVPVGQIAQRFQRSRASIYRVINERRAFEAQRVELTYYHAPAFDRDDAEAVLLRRGVEDEARAAAKDPPQQMLAALPEALQPLYHRPVIADRWQHFLLLRYNFLKFKASQLRAGLDRHHPRARELDAFDQRVGELRSLRSLMIQTNLPTVLSLARRHLLDKPDPGQQRLLQLLALGHRVLGEAIETYDPSRSQEFAAYLSNRLMRRFANDPAVTDQAPSKAHRRLTGEQAVAWLYDDASQANVELPQIDTAGPTP
jgi:DNA-directed RNA polymerase specialized sigma subunit